MSTIEDVIVDSSVKAFNSGYRHGRTDERAQIIEIARQLAVGENNIGEFLYLKDLIEYIEDVKIA